MWTAQLVRMTDRKKRHIERPKIRHFFALINTGFNRPSQENLHIFYNKIRDLNGFFVNL